MRLWFTVVVCALGAVTMALRSSIALPKQLELRLLAELMSHYERRVAWVTWVSRLWRWTFGLAGFGTLWPIDKLQPPWPLAAWIGSFAFFFIVGGEIADDLDALVEWSRFTSLSQVIEELGWEPAWTEAEYRANLVEHLHSSLGVRQKAEFPVATGSRVDIWISFRDAEWFITIKRGIDNQKRLTMQGEAEDIVSEIIAKKIKRAVIVAVVGVREDRPGMQETHIASLEERLLHRHADVTHVHEGKVDIKSLVIRVPLRGVSSPATIAY